MSLKVKMYLGFLAVIFLAMVVGLMAVMSFRTINNNVDTTNAQVRENTSQIVPLSGVFNRLAGSVVEAGNSFYAFIFNYLDTDFQNGEKALALVKTSVDEVQAILDKGDPAGMPTSRAKLPIVREQARRLDETTQDLRETVVELLKIRSGMVAAGETAMKALAEGFIEGKRRADKVADEDLADRQKLRDDLTRRTYRLQVLNQTSALIAAARVAFWQSQSLYGQEASDAYDRAISSMESCVDGLKKYQTPENVRDAETEKTFKTMQSNLEVYLAGMIQLRRMNEKLDALAAETNSIYQAAEKAVTEAAFATNMALISSTGTIQSGMNNIDGTVRNYSWAVMMIVGGALVIGLVIATLLVGNVTRPINRIISTLTAGSDQISAAAAQIASASQNLAEGSTSQAASLEETSSALEQMASMTRQNADNATKTNTTTIAVGKLVQEGGEAMREMSGAMRDINDKSEKVGHIVKTIEDIAFQTNLLALNAAVEAARAGEAGKGFAVVADEVRNLSQRSAQAAKDTTDLINGTVESVRHGSQIAERLTTSFEHIEEGAKKVSELINEIASATNEQAQGVDQVNTAVAQMDKVTQHNAANSEETASSSEELSAQASSFVDAIDELVNLIAGRNGGRHAAGAGLRGDGHGKGLAPREGRHVPRAVPAALPAPKSKDKPRVAKVTSADVIPLNSADFSNF